MGSSCSATAPELMLNQDTEMNCSGVSESNLDVGTLPAPASSSSSTTSSNVVDEAAFPLTDEKQAKSLRKETKITTKQQLQLQIQQLLQISGSAIQLLQQLQPPQQCQVQQNQSTQTALQDPVQIAALIQQKVAELKELERQLVSMQSAETTEVHLQQSVRKIIDQLKQIPHFILQLKQQGFQLPSTESSASSSTPPQQRNSLDVVPVADNVEIPASSNDYIRVHEEKSLSGVAENYPIQSQTINQQILIPSRQLLESVPAPGQSRSAPVESTTLAATPEPAMESNMDPSSVLLPSASEEPKALVTVSSAGTTPTGSSLADVMNANSRKKNKSTPIPPRHITSTDTNGFDSNGLGLNDVDGGTKLEIFQPTINGLENPSFLPSINSPAGTSNVIPICHDHIPAPHPVGVSTAVVPALPAGASTIAAAGQCNQPLLSPPTLDSETDSDREETLSLACTSGKEETVELLLSKGTIIEHRDKKGLTPLMLAATAGHQKVVEVLLNHGAKIEAQDEKTQDTALALACSGGHFKVVELLLKRGANKENHNVNDYTPLTMAASEGHVEIIKLLLANGAEVNSYTDSKRGLSPLMMAANNGHVAAVRILLEMGSDINAIIKCDGYTALTLACYYGKIEVVRILLEKKANVEQRTKQGFTPLQLSASVGRPEVAQVLIDYGACVNAPPTPSRDTALTCASDKGLVQFVELLLKHGAHVDVKNNKGNSALWLAANNGHLQVVELLHKAKADIDLKNNREVSCLMAAFRKGHVKLVEWMVKRVTQFPSDEEILRILAIANIDLLPKYQLCKEIICAAKDRQAAEANKNAAYLLEELEMEKKREHMKLAAAAKKREKKKLKKQEKRQVDGSSIDSNLQERDENDDEDGKSYSNPHTADSTPTTSNNKEAEDGNFGGEKSRKNSVPALATEDVTPVEVKPSKRRDQIKKSALPPQVESNVKVDDSQQLSKRGINRNKENVSNDTSITAGQYPTRCANNESSSNSLKSLTTTYITNPKKPIKKEEEWKEVVRRRPLSSQENSGSAAGAAMKGPPSDRASATLSIIHSSKRCKKVIVPSNVIGRVIGQAGCNINAIQEISGALVDIEKQRKGQTHRTILIRGMPEYISQAQWLISALMKEPEKKFSELLTEFKARGTDFFTQTCTSLNKSATGTSHTGPVLQSKGTRTATTTSTTPPPLYSMNALALSSPSQPSASTVATSVVSMSALASRPTSTSADQDYSPFNRPLSKAEGTSMPGIYTSGLSVNVMDTPVDNSINETLFSPTYLESGRSIPSSGAMKVPGGSLPYLLTRPPRSGSPTQVNSIPIQPLIPVGNCYLPPPPQQKTIPESGVKGKDPLTSTASLVPGDASASATRKKRKRPHKKTQHHLPKFDGVSITNLDGMTHHENRPMKLHEKSFSLAPGVGRPSICRLGVTQPNYAPMFEGGASRLSITAANLRINSGVHARPMNGGDMQQPPNRMPILKFGPDYPVPIGTTYYDKQLMVRYLGPGLGPGAVNRMSDSPPNQLGLLDVSTKYRSALAATSTICRVCYGSIMGTSFRCVQCEDYNMCCVCVTSGKHPQHPVIRTAASNMDRDTDTMAASLTGMKRDSASTALVEKLMAKIAEQNVMIAEQDVKIKEQDAKIEEKDAEIEHLVSARSEAVALLFRPFDRTLDPKKKEKEVEPVQGPL